MGDGMKKPELLAPAGNMESLKAAVCAGCDAVYIGGKQFGARSFASNFSNEEIVDAIGYVHQYGVKLYMTINTLIYEEEIEEFLSFVDFIHQNKIDAVIVQDIGMMDLLHQTYPNLEIHASTQMHIHNLEGLLLLEKLGIKRAVLARETDIDTIQTLKKKTNVELEVFVHGALCVSYSGQCLMSSLIGGRSGNRGACAGSCRQKYDLIYKDGEHDQKINWEEYLLSLKDLCTLEKVGDMIEAGIDSFKIEGRMKRPEYVFQIVTLYRRAIDQYIKEGTVTVTETDILEMKKLFHREFTKGFLFHETNDQISNPLRPNHMGIPIGKVIAWMNGKATIELSSPLHTGDGIRVVGNSDVGCTITTIWCKNQNVKEAYIRDVVIIPLEEVKVGSVVLKTTDQVQMISIAKQLEVKRSIFITGILVFQVGFPAQLTLFLENIEVTAKTEAIVEKATNQPILKERLREQISKLGNTVYEMEFCEIMSDEDGFMAMKTLNELRRDAVFKLDEERTSASTYFKQEYKREVPTFEPERKSSILVETVAQYQKYHSCFDQVYLENNLFEKGQEKTILKLPRVMNEFNTLDTPLLVGELGSLYHYQNVITDFSFNVVNSYAVAFLHALGATKVTLSYELTDEQIISLIHAYEKRYETHPRLEWIVYGREEAMVCKYNLLDRYQIRGDCYLKDRFGHLYPIRIKNNFMYLYNEKIRNLGNIDFYHKIGIDWIRVQLLSDMTLDDMKQ